MNIEIRKLVPELAEDYVRFFDDTPHNTVNDKCYCVTWRSDDSFVSDEPWFSTREERRARAISFVRTGSIRGYLAYHGEEIVGWCNTNENCSMCIDYLRSFYPIEEYSPDIKVKPIFCFVIKPELQRKGIATQLVLRICKDAADDGFDYVEAYVNESFINTIQDFRGPLKMYENCGFVKYAVKDNKAVMRKGLK